MRPSPPAPSPPGVDRSLALLSYDGSGRELVARLKYRNWRGALPWLADGMAALVGRTIDLSEPITVTFAPTTSPRRRERGFDQAALLSRAVARRIAKPHARLLARLPGPALTELSKDERSRAVRFVARRRPPAAVLLVDDVSTTGATLSAAAIALKEGGTETVIALTAARTPAHRAPRPAGRPSVHSDQV